MSLERSLYSKENVRLFNKYLNLTELTGISNADEKILNLYDSLKDRIPRLIERGFDEKYTNLNFKEWAIFIPNIIEKIDTFYDKYTGEEKLEMLLMVCIYIIILHLPIPIVDKELLIVYIKEFIPEIVESIISATKKVHTFLSKLRKRLRCCV